MGFKSLSVWNIEVSNENGLQVIIQRSFQARNMLDLIHSEGWVLLFRDSKEVIIVPSKFRLKGRKVCVVMGLVQGVEPDCSLVIIERTINLYLCSLVVRLTRCFWIVKYLWKWNWKSRAGRRFGVYLVVVFGVLIASGRYVWLDSVEISCSFVVSFEIVFVVSVPLLLLVPVMWERSQLRPSDLYGRLFFSSLDSGLDLEGDLLWTRPFLELWRVVLSWSHLPSWSLS